MVEKKIYRVEWTEEAEKQLAQIDKTLGKKLYEKTNHDLSLDPFNNGEPLLHELKGLWSFHFSRYRVIYRIEKEKVLVSVLEVDHRKNIYRKSSRKFK